MNLPSLNDLLKFWLKSVSRNCFLCYEILTRLFYCKARANKSKDKPDSELNEFEQVSDDFGLIIMNVFEGLILVCFVRSLRNINYKVKKIKHWRNVLKARKLLRRSELQEKVGTFSSI